MTDTSNQWLSNLTDLRTRETPCVLMTIIESKGSTPREAGTKMVVTINKQFGTIGGGNLEFEAIEQARTLLENARNTPEIQKYALGPAIAQCCGGTVTILLEPFLSVKKTLVLFGAGHIGKEIIHVMQNMPINIKWIDERANEFPSAIPDNVERIITDTPIEVLRDIPDDSYILVITHQHKIDFSLVQAALTHNQFSYLGLIGSKSKKAKFKKNLLAGGLSNNRIKDMTCPIGINGITGKHPREIAISVAAELLQLGL